MSFSILAFETALVDIERHLGYLRGNEAAWEYLQQYPIDGNSPTDAELEDGYTAFPVWLDDGYRFPCPDAQYAVEPKSPILAYIVNTTNDPDLSRDFVKTVQGNMDQAWRNGEAWAGGVADYLRSVCDQFTQVDVPGLSDEIRSMQTDVVDAILLNESNDNWAQLGSMYTRWTGNHATAFQNWYDNYNDVEARYGRYLSEVTTGFAMFCGLASATQLGAQRFLDDVLTGIKEQLAQWTGYRGDPETQMPPAWVADIPGVAEQILGLATYLPVVGAGAKGVQSGISGAKQVNALLERFTGEGNIPAGPKPVACKTAEQLYSEMTKTLHTDYYTAYRHALESLNAGASSGGVDGGNLDSQTFSARNLLDTMAEADGGWEIPVYPGSLAGKGDQY